MIFYPSMCKIITEKNQNECIKKYENDVTKCEDDYIQKEYEKAKIYNDILSGEITGKQCEEYENILNLTGDGVMAYLEIPKISVYFPIYHGTESEILQKGVRSY